MLRLTGCLLLAAAAMGQTPQELGRVSWMRNFDAACAEAAKRDRPLLVLFQEVPG